MLGQKSERPIIYLAYYSSDKKIYKCVWFCEAVGCDFVHFNICILAYMGVFV